MTNEPSAAAQIMTGIAALLQAIAWPVVVIVLLIAYRAKVGATLDVLQKKVADAKRVKAGGVEIESEIQNVLDRAGAVANEEPLNKQVSPAQIEVAKDLRERLQAAPISPGEGFEMVRNQVYELADEYERLRAEMPSSSLRTRKMNEIAAKMRALAYAGRPLLADLMKGRRAGERLAAICMLQVWPDLGAFSWLMDRIKRENQAFLLYHSALAALEVIKSSPYLNPEAARKAVQEALDYVLRFDGGPPDQNTIEVLHWALAALEKNSSLA